MKACEGLPDVDFEGALETCVMDIKVRQERALVTF